MFNIWDLLAELLPALLSITALIKAKGGHGKFAVSIDVKDPDTGAVLLDQQVTTVTL